jgi:hypothetical protein
MYYFVPLFPFIAIATGWLISRWLEFVKNFIKVNRNFAAKSLLRRDFIGWLVYSAVLIALIIISPKLETNLRYYDQQIKKPLEQRTHKYIWQPGLLPDFINSLVQKTIWKDERVIGDVNSSFTYLLWHESRIFDAVDEMVEESCQRTEQGDKIFGDSGTVPLLALLSGRPIAAKEVDTNIQRYLSGFADPDLLTKRIDDAKTKIIILRHKFGVANLISIQRLIDEKYHLVKQFRTRQGHTYLMYERNII